MMLLAMKTSNVIVMFHLSCWLRILFFCQMCVMVTDVKGTEDFQQWVLMSNELVMATCTVNNKETSINKINWKHAHKQITFTAT